MRRVMGVALPSATVKVLFNHTPKEFCAVLFVPRLPIGRNSSPCLTSTNSYGIPYIFCDALLATCSKKQGEGPDTLNFLSLSLRAELTERTQNDFLWHIALTHAECEV